MTNHIKTAVLAAGVLLLGGCNDADKFDYGKEVLVMTGTEVSPIIKFVVEGTPSTYPVTVSSTGKVSSPVTVSIKVDNSLVEKYNQANKTNYYVVPDGAVELDASSVVIEAGQASSTTAPLRVVSTENFKDGCIYMIPVTITGVQGGMEVLETSRTAYLRISRVVEFNSLDLSDYSMYSNYIFPDELAVDLSNYTYELKCYVNAWHPGSEPISRVCQWTSKTESQSNMLRFGENGQDVNSLQWVNPAGNLISKTRFTEQIWYTLSFTYDGSTLVMYVDGVKDGEMSGSGETTFQRIELGMSWAGYPSKQVFLGRIAEMRVWNRALSSSEIQLGLCGVDVESEGLIGYWKFDEGQGYTFADATGHGYDMDWSDTSRCPTESSDLEPYDASAQVAASWVFDDKNKCSN